VHEVGRESLEHPAGVRPFLNQAEMLESIQELADPGRRDPKSPSKVEFIYGGAGPRVIPQHPFHEALFDLSR
jgi:hypothetical protein